MPHLLQRRGRFDLTRVFLFCFLFSQGGGAAAHGAMGGQVSLRLQNVGQRFDGRLGAVPIANIRAEGT